MRLYNFKTSKNSNINYYFNAKKQVIKTNILSDKLTEYTPSEYFYNKLKEVNKYVNKKIKYLDLNGGVFNNPDELKACCDYLLTLNKKIKILTSEEVINSRKKATATAVNNNIVDNTPEETPEQANSNIPVEEQNQVKSLDKNYCLEVVNKIVDFFKEFNTDATKSNRFINTLMNKAKEGLNSAKNYAKSYFYSMDFPQAEGISYKLDSYEFEEIVNNLATIESNKHINKRLYIYFGPAGTGKTTQAIKDYSEASVINCNSDMMAQDLFETFEFNEGKPDFKKSEFVKAMEEGKPIILDEINLLRLDALRALQTITDNKQVFNYKGQNIQIKEGFKIIGTMNLTVNGRVFSLPEPLVDRCADIKEFTISNEELVERAF